jgi:hypothetical protein
VWEVNKKVKVILIVLGVICILVLGFLLYQKLSYKPPIPEDIVEVEEIEDKVTPEQQEEEVIVQEKPSPITYEEEPVEVEKEPEGSELGMNEIRRDPIITNDNLTDNNDKLFVEGDIEEITDIIDLRDEYIPPSEESLEEQRKEKERQERNKEFIDAKLDAVSIIRGSQGHVNFFKNVPKKGMVVIYWSTLVKGGSDTIDKWIDYYNKYKDDVEFVFLNRGFEVEIYSRVSKFAEERGWDIPIYFDSMLSFLTVHDIQQSTEGFFINKDGFIMGREKSKDLVGAEQGIKGLIEFYEQHKGVWEID